MKSRSHFSLVFSILSSKASPSSRVLALQLLLLILGAFGCVFSLSSIFYPVKFLNFTGFWLLTIVFLLLKPYFTDMYHLLFSESPQKNHVSLTAVGSILFSLPFYFIMLCHLVLYLLTFPASLALFQSIFPNPIVGVGCLSNDKFICGIYSNVSWMFSFEPLSNLQCLIFPFLIFGSPIWFCVFGSFVNSTHVLTSKSFTSKYKTTAKTLFCFPLSSHPGCVQLSLSIASYVLLTLNMSVIGFVFSRHITSLFLTVISGFIGWKLIVWKKHSKRLFPVNLEEISLTHIYLIYYILNVVISLFLISEHIGRLISLTVKVVFGHCWRESLCEFTFKEYSFVNNLVAFLVSVTTFFSVYLCLMLYSQIRKAMAQSLEDYKTFVESQVDETGDERIVCQ
ncbi:hypothetical protein GEMRC1_010171 [Eukaryota sp. GEM-RC1]